jgi:hypothetical protein
MHFAGCPTHAVFAVMDLVTRMWITEFVSIRETPDPGDQDGAFPRRPLVLSQAAQA